MPVYRFRGLNSAGQVVAGIRAASSRDALAVALRREQIRLTRAEEKRIRTLWPARQRVGDQELALILDFITRANQLTREETKKLREGAAQPAKSKRTEAK